MEFTFDQKIYEDAIDEVTIAGLNRAGAFIDGKIVQNIAKTFKDNKGGLSSSTNWTVNESAFILRNNVNKSYAPIQELGGEIRPVDAKALAIPIHPDAKGKSPRDFDDLVYIKRDGANPLLIREAGRGKNRVDLMYVLVKRVKIPARPFIRPAVYDNTNKIIELMK